MLSLRELSSRRHNNAFAPVHITHVHLLCGRSPTQLRTCGRCGIGAMSFVPYPWSATPWSEPSPSPPLLGATAKHICGRRTYRRERRLARSFCPFFFFFFVCFTFLAKDCSLRMGPALRAHVSKGNERW